MNYVAAFLFALVLLRMASNRSIRVLPWFACYLLLATINYATWTPHQASLNVLHVALLFFKLAACVEAYLLLVRSHFAAERRAGLWFLLSAAVLMGLGQVTLLRDAAPVEWYRYGRQIGNTTAAAFCVFAALSLWLRPVAVPRAVGQHAVTLAVLVCWMTAVNLINATWRPDLAGWQMLNGSFWVVAWGCAASWLTSASNRQTNH